MILDSFILARVLHVLGIVLWIGGVAMVTTTILPALKNFPPADRVTLFEKIERQFARQARWTTLLTGLSGFYLLFYFNAWSRYLFLEFWWVHLMTLVWVMFTLVLFVLEPLFLHRWFLQKSQQDPVKTFALIQTMHWVLLTLSLLAIVGAVTGSHGGRWF